MYNDSVCMYVCIYASPHTHTHTMMGHCGLPRMGKSKEGWGSNVDSEFIYKSYDKKS